MNNENKERMKWGLEVLLLIIMVSLGIAAGVGSFNYATLAKQAGDPDNIFWLVGVANIIFAVLYAVWRGKQIRDEHSPKKEK